MTPHNFQLIQVPTGSNNDKLNTSFSIGTEYFINQLDDKNN